MRAIIVLCAALALAVSPAVAQASSISELVAGSNDTTILLAAVQAAGLDELVSDPKLVATVFAPTDNAFLAALAALNLTAEEILANTELLTSVLSYHVVPGAAIMSSNLVDGQLFATLLSGPTGELKFVAPDSLVTTSSQTVGIIGTDLMAGKAVVHLIDTVMLPGDMYFSAPGPSPESEMMML